MSDAALPPTAYRAFFGDGERTFCLTVPMIVELERLSGQPIAAIFARFSSLAFSHAEMIETVRLGLVGGGTDPKEAKRLVDTYAMGRPIAEVRPLAWAILRALWLGPEAAAPSEEEPAA